MLRSKLVPEVSALAAAGSAKNYAALARTKGRLANKAREIAADIVRFAEEGPNGRQMCAELREACLHKGELGEQGEGNCRRYRQTCRGR
jgi:hypothetical protein